jgi:hypothetical protein
MTDLRIAGANGHLDRLIPAITQDRASRAGGEAGAGRQFHGLR